MQARKQVEVDELKSDEDDFTAAFPEFQDEDDEEDEEPELDLEEEIFFLWTTNESVYRIYKCLTMFLKDYRLDPTLMSKLIEERNLPFEQTLEEIACCHSGYLSIIVKADKEAIKDKEDV